MVTYSVQIFMQSVLANEIGHMFIANPWLTAVIIALLVLGILALRRRSRRRYR